MTFSSAQMRDLETQSSAFCKEHSTYLADAVNAVRVSGHCRSALHLLDALARNARRNQQEVIADVRRWLERRLRDAPEISPDRLMLELGWLRRMSVARDAEGVDARSARENRSTRSRKRR